MSNVSDFLIEAGCGDAITLPLEIKYVPAVASETGTTMASFFTVELAFEDTEEAECYVLDGEPIRGFGDTVEEAMELFMTQLHEFASEATEPFHKAEGAGLSEDESALVAMLDNDKDGALLTEENRGLDRDVFNAIFAEVVQETIDMGIVEVS